MTTTRKPRRKKVAPKKSGSNGALDHTDHADAEATVAKVHADDAARAPFVQLVKELRGAFAGRDLVARGIVVGMLAGEHTFLLGPPGTAKSALTRALCGAIDGATYWEYLFTRFTEPNEVFGPIDLQRWSDKGEYHRRTEGTMLTADIVFADEVFKANSSILNALLAVLNERRYHEGGRTLDVPLVTCVAASNELPEGGTAGELAALYDRFLLRFEVTKTRDRDGFLKVMRGAKENPTVDVRITGQQLDAARTLALATPIGPDVDECLHALDEELYREAALDTSLRRWKKLRKVLRAHAWLAGDPAVDPLHFDILEHGLWDEPKQRMKVREVVSKTSAPKLAEATEVFDAIMEAHNALPSSGGVKDAGGVTVNSEMQKAVAAFDALLDETSGTIASRIGKMRREVDVAQQKLAHRLGVEMGIFPAGSTPDIDADEDEDEDEVDDDLGSVAF